MRITVKLVYLYQHNLENLNLEIYLDILEKDRIVNIMIIIMMINIIKGILGQEKIRNIKNQEIRIQYMMMILMMTTIITNKK